MTIFFMLVVLNSNSSNGAPIEYLCVAVKGIVISRGFQVCGLDKSAE
jgi:hypothetical protein